MIGASLSELVGGPILLMASGLALVVVGQRVLRPIEESTRSAGTLRRKNRLLLVAASAGVGLVTGLLANGGGFLLVPMYLLVFGLRMREAAGTSLLVIIALAIPTLATHWALGHIDWAVAGAFALGAIPTSIGSSQLAHRVTGCACVTRSVGSSSAQASLSPECVGRDLGSAREHGDRLRCGTLRAGVAGRVRCIHLIGMRASCSEAHIGEGTIPAELLTTCAIGVGSPSR